MVKNGSILTKHSFYFLTALLSRSRCDRK